MAVDLAKKLRKEGVDENAVRKAVKKYGSKIAEDFIKDEGKEGLKDLMDMIGDCVTEHGAGLLDHLGDLLDGFF